MLVQPVCRTCLDTTLLVFSWRGSFTVKDDCIIRRVKLNNASESFMVYINVFVCSGIDLFINYAHVCCLFVRITCPCNEYPLKPHFYIVKLGYAGVYLYVFFLFLPQNIDYGCLLEPPRRGGSNMYPQSMFRAEAFLTSTHNLCFEQI